MHPLWYPKMTCQTWIDPEFAVDTIFANEIKSSVNPEKVRQEKIAEFDKRYNNIYHAGARQLFQDIIDPRNTRGILVRSLEWFADKKEEDRPWKKHGNIPI